MAGENRNKTEAVVLFKEIQQHPYRFGFYQAVRRINCQFKDMALTGKAYFPSEDPVRFAQIPYLSFAPATLSALTYNGPGGVPRLSQRFMGLFGPNGPMPTHITEYARQRLNLAHDATLAHFADMFHHRMISFYYRAWAHSQPTVQHDRPGQDRFSEYIAALAGLGMPSFKDTDAMPHASKLHFTGHLSSLPRHAAGLASILISYFKVPVRIVEFVSHWLKIPPRDHLKLGVDHNTGALGMSTVLGERVWQRQDKFQVCMGPLSLDDYEALLPTGRSFTALVASVRNYLGVELLWETRLLLKVTEKPVTCLGKQGALGWTSWLQSEEPQEEVGDLVLQTSGYLNL
jgi:type VI secretion system protein ImpH